MPCGIWIAAGSAIGFIFFHGVGGESGRGPKDIIYDLLDWNDDVGVPRFAWRNGLWDDDVRLCFSLFMSWTA